MAKNPKKKELMIHLMHIYLRAHAFQELLQMHARQLPCEETCGTTSGRPKNGDNNIRGEAHTLSITRSRR